MKDITKLTDEELLSLNDIAQISDEELLSMSKPLQGGLEKTNLFPDRGLNFFGNLGKDVADVWQGTQYLGSQAAKQIDDVVDLPFINKKPAFRGNLLKEKVASGIKSLPEVGTSFLKGIAAQYGQQEGFNPLAFAQSFYMHPLNILDIAPAGMVASGIKATGKLPPIAKATTFIGNMPYAKRIRNLIAPPENIRFIDENFTNINKRVDVYNEEYSKKIADTLSTLNKYEQEELVNLIQRGGKTNNPKIEEARQILRNLNKDTTQKYIEGGYLDSDVAQSNPAKQKAISDWVADTGVQKARDIITYNPEQALTVQRLTEEQIAKVADDIAKIPESERPFYLHQVYGEQGGLLDYLRGQVQNELFKNLDNSLKAEGFNPDVLKQKKVGYAGSLMPINLQKALESPERSLTKLYEQSKFIDNLVKDSALIKKVEKPPIPVIDNAKQNAYDIVSEAIGENVIPQSNILPKSEIGKIQISPDLIKEAMKIAYKETQSPDMALNQVLSNRTELTKMAREAHKQGLPVYDVDTASLGRIVELTQPKNKGNVEKFWDAANKSFKRSVLPTLPFITANRTGNFINNLYAGVGIPEYAKAIKSFITNENIPSELGLSGFYKNELPGNNSKNIGGLHPVIDTIEKAYNPISGGMLGGIAGNVAGSVLDSFIPYASPVLTGIGAAGGSFLGGNKIIDKIFETESFLDNLDRRANYFKQAEKGLPVEETVTQVNKSLGDYASQAPEIMGLTKIIPFGKFITEQAKVTGRQLGNMGINNPAGLIQRQIGNYGADRAEEQYNKLKEEGYKPELYQKYNTVIGENIESGRPEIRPYNRVIPQVSNSELIRQLAEGDIDLLRNSLTPLLRIPAELYSGTNYRNRPATSPFLADTAYGRAYMPLGADGAEYINNNLPLPEAVNYAGAQFIRSFIPGPGIVERFNPEGKVYDTRLSVPYIGDTLLRAGLPLVSGVRPNTERGADLQRILGLSTGIQEIYPDRKSKRKIRALNKANNKIKERLENE